MRSIVKTLAQRKILLADGAWGTFLQKSGLELGHPPELLNITSPDIVRHIADSYINAGSDIILTNSFGGHPLRLKDFRLEDKAYEINKLASEISRNASGRNFLVAGSMGPSGAFRKLNDAPDKEVFDGFKLQAKALIEGGADAICIETMYSINEAYLAIKAVKEYTDAEIICTFTFDKTLSGYRTMMGVTPNEMVNCIAEAGADVIGANCGNGIEQIIHVVREMRERNNSIPIMAKPNAGLPYMDNGVLNYYETPDIMKDYFKELLNAGASIIGGCCGTGPKHIKVFSDMLRS